VAATFDSVDLLGIDLAHPRLRTRPARPMTPPPLAADRLPSAMPATAQMEAPVWPGLESAPPVRTAARVLSSPPVPPRLAAASIVPREAVVDVVAPAQPVAAPVQTVAAPAQPVVDGAFDAETAAWFTDDAAETYADPYFDERPAGAPWWAIAIPASAALGMVAMVLTALVLVASRA